MTSLPYFSVNAKVFIYEICKFHQDIQFINETMVVQNAKYNLLHKQQLFDAYPKSASKYVNLLGKDQQTKSFIQISDVLVAIAATKNVP